MLPHKSKGHVGRKSLTKCILVVSQRIGLKNLLRWPPMGITLAMYFNALASIKLGPKYIVMFLHYRSLLMSRLYSHNNLKEAKEQFEIMFINDVLQDNDYSLRKSAETLGMHYSGLHRKMRHLGMPKTYRRTPK